MGHKNEAIGSEVGGFDERVWACEYYVDEVAKDRKKRSVYIVLILAYTRDNKVYMRDAACLLLRSGSNMVGRVPWRRESWY